MNLHLAIEKDKTNMCLQGEGNFSVIHNVPPFGSRHITQVIAGISCNSPDKFIN
jgi:hypothetical protein